MTKSKENGITCLSKEINSAFFMIAKGNFLAEGQRCFCGVASHGSLRIVHHLQKTMLEHDNLKCRSLEHWKVRL